MFRPGNSTQGRWAPLIMDTASVQTKKRSAGMVGSPHNRHSRFENQELGTGKVVTLHNGEIKRAGPGTQHRNGEPS